MRRRLILPVLLLACAPAFAQRAPAPVQPEQPTRPAQNPAAPAAQRSPSASPGEATPSADDAGKVPLDEIRRFVSVFNAVRQAHVEPISDARLMQSASAACCSTLTRTASTSSARRPRVSRKARAAPTKASAWSCSARRTARCA